MEFSFYPCIAYREKNKKGSVIIIAKTERLLDNNKRTNE